MKKIICFVLTLCLFPVIALAENYKEMTDDELYSALNQIRNELITRNAKSEKNFFVCDDELLQIYLTGKGKESRLGFAIQAVFVNKSDKEIRIDFDHIIVNGWEVKTVFSGVEKLSGNSKIKNDIVFDLEEADLDNYTEIEDIELSFRVIDDDYNTLKQYNNIRITIDGSGWE